MSNQIKIPIASTVNPNFVSAFSKLCRTNIEADQLSLARAIATIEAEAKVYRSAQKNIESKLCVVKDGRVGVPVEHIESYNAEIEKLNSGTVTLSIEKIKLSSKIRSEKDEPFTAMDIHVLSDVVDWS